MGISIQMVQREGWDLIGYEGPIDAEAEVHLAQLLPKLGSHIVFNFRNTGAVNSCGVRSWINFMRELQKSPRQIVFQECTGDIVMQMNMIPSFKGNALVQSVFGAYVCDACGHEETVLFEAGKTLPDNPEVELPPRACPECKAQMELAEMEEEYFAFLAA